MYWPCFKASVLCKIVLFWCLSNAINCNASTPAEMAELSLQDLLQLSVAQVGWSFNLAYSRKELDGYQNNKKRLSDAEVAFSPGTEPRSNNNYPVVPTKIVQQAYLLSARYQFSENHALTINLPYIEQTTDHFSIVPSYESFTLKSAGIGDIKVNFHYSWEPKLQSSAGFNLGISVPTGSIDKKGDTPRAPGNQQLPYTMQLGSGTWDLPLAFSYQQKRNAWLWGSRVNAHLRFGKNNHNYRLGNRFALNTWLRWQQSRVLQPELHLNYAYSQSIHGQDDDLTVPGLFSYPANITDPDNFGGSEFSVTLGLLINIDLVDGWPQFIRLSYEIPLQQDLNGIQIKKRNQLKANLQWQL